MKVKFNPARAWFFAACIGAYFVFQWLRENIRLPRIPELDQLYVIGALAILGITIVGILRLWLNSSRH